ncbi:MAG TPA: hypothetical protein VGZ69_07065 [Candidatus Rhabdochlamydia sp.]|nr:hypothetical protein [Candidatus Rhabdochlamydia sp.]
MMPLSTFIHYLISFFIRSEKRQKIYQKDRITASFRRKSFRAYFFLLLLLIPNLIYAKSHQEKCTNTYNKALFEWNRHNELIEDFKRLEPKDKESVQIP